MGPVEITANLNSANNSSSSSSSDALTSSDSSYSLSSSYADETNSGLDKFMLTSELNNAHSCEHYNMLCDCYMVYLHFTIATTANQDSVVKSDHSYFKAPDPSADNGENDEGPKRKKGRPRRYNVESPSSSKTQTKLTNFSNSKSTTKSNSPSASKSRSAESTPNSKRPTRNQQPKYKLRLINCAKCVNCLRADCGKCRNCLDKPKFGGKNTKKQRCIQRICIHRVSVYYIPLVTYYTGLTIDIIRVTWIGNT